jgi:hypothetical protein
MACCALAAFLIGQLLLFWGRVRRPLGDKGKSASAAQWRSGDPLAARQTGRARRQFGAGLAAAGALGLVGIAYAASGPARVELGTIGIYAPICGDQGPHGLGIFGRL